MAYTLAYGVWYTIRSPPRTQINKRRFIMAHRLPVSSFAIGKLVPLSEMRLTPFQQSDTPEKLEWANNILADLYNDQDVVEIQINQHGCPSVATYMSWLQRAMKESYRGDKKAVQSRIRGNSLFIRVVDRKELHRNGKVKHIIT